ncbi:MAG: ATP-dependent DNA helicase UvrD2 [Acidimicrobiales bacterium]
MAEPGPTVLGRGVVIVPGRPVPAAWSGAPRVVVDAGAVADPSEVVAHLHQLWATRTPVVVELAVDPASFREPRGEAIEPWVAGPGWEPWLDRLHFLVWANNYDARGDDIVWWLARKAARVAARGGVPQPVEDERGDLVLETTPVWVDGGPRGPLPETIDGCTVVHRETVELGRLATQPAAEEPTAALAPDQLAAVSHGAGPARIIAPAGSGKTRVLTERLRELLGARGYEPEAVLAVAYNRKAQQEMAERTPELGARVQTLNAWGYSLAARWLGRRPQVLDERDVRRIVEDLVPRQRRRVNTDPLGPYLDGLSLIRLGLRDPQEVEDTIEDAPGLAAAFVPYRAELRRRGVVDFDEQIYLAVEALVADGPFRRAVQADHRHLLVDELQDLTPAHMLLVRLVSCPAYDVFGVGDDDQTIYGHAGADPRFLIDFARWFPGARSHALEVNYRCAARVTEAAARLLSYNHRRVDKVIRAGPGVGSDPAALDVRLHATDAGAASLVEIVTGWLAAGEGGVEPAHVAVLTRVNSLLLAPHVALAEAGVVLDSTLGDEVLARLGVRAALAYLRIAAAPDALDPADLIEVHRRPSRGLPQWAEKWLGRCRSIEAVRDAGGRIDDAKVATKFDDLAFDLDRLASLAARGATTRELLLAIRDSIGLGSAMTLLDSSGGAAGSHLDDLEALLQVADLHPEAVTFAGWLRDALHRERVEGGVTLSTIHRVKGREWDRVVVFGVTDGIVPHRLAEDIEEERRVLHVAITRCRDTAIVLGDAGRPSPFLAELDGSAPHERRLRLVDADAAPHERGRDAVRGLERPRPVGADAAAGALRAWRLERSRSDAVPAYVVLSDKHLEGIADALPSTLVALRSCPGIGPAKLEAYGDDILAVVASVLAAPAGPQPNA